MKVKSPIRDRIVDCFDDVSVISRETLDNIESLIASEAKTSYNRGYFRARREPVEHRIVNLPFSTVSGFWNGDIFEEWLKSDEEDGYIQLKKFLRLRDDLIKKQAVNKLLRKMALEGEK